MASFKVELSVRSRLVYSPTYHKETFIIVADVNRYQACELAREAAQKLHLELESREVLALIELP